MPQSCKTIIPVCKAVAILLADYLKHYGSEVVNMLFEEYDAEKALEIKEQEDKPTHYKWGLKPQKQKNAAVLQDRYDLQDCGSFSVTN